MEVVFPMDYMCVSFSCLSLLITRTDLILLKRSTG